MTEGAARYLFVLLAAPLAAFAFAHRLSAHTGEPLDRRQEGLAILIGLRVTGVAMFVLFGCWFLAPGKIAFARLTLPGWLRWFGFALGAVMVPWYVWVFRTLGRNVTDTVVTRKEHELVVSGPYRWVRHPLYAGLPPWGLSLGLLMGNWLLWPLAAAGFVLLALRTPIEERFLAARFGEAYLDYMRRTPRYVPRFWGHKRTGGGEFRTL
jgi:protein-S-isoprenylcysteine O-methyltransferase Ste14